MKNYKYELEQFYKGDDDWKDYVEFYSKIWNTCNYKDLLLSELGNDLNLAQVVYGILEDESLVWINCNIPALDNLKPVECIDDENLKKRLKVVLTRFPI